MNAFVYSLSSLVERLARIIISTDVLIMISQNCIVAEIINIDIIYKLVRFILWI